MALIVIAVVLAEELAENEELENGWEQERQEYQASLAENDVVY